MSATAGGSLLLALPSSITYRHQLTAERSFVCRGAEVLYTPITRHHNRTRNPYFGALRVRRSLLQRKAQTPLRPHNKLPQPRCARCRESGREAGGPRGAAGGGIGGRICGRSGLSAPAHFRPLCFCAVEKIAQLSRCGLTHSLFTGERFRRWKSA